MAPRWTAMTARFTSLWWSLLIACLLILRLPSLVQPAGADQGLYAYVGTRILEGELPYRDAWDQKPPAIHFTYAAMYGLWRHDSIVAVLDFAVAAAVAWLLASLGSALTGDQAAGRAAAALFLLLWRSIADSPRWGAGPLAVRDLHRRRRGGRVAPGNQVSRR